MNSERIAEAVENTKKMGVLEFCGFEFDQTERSLRRDGTTVALPPKTCELLAVLIQDHGRLITKQELFDRVWPDTFVEEANLSHHIAVLRKALGEKRDSNRFIETVARRGYRFVAPVTERDAEDEVEIRIEETHRSRMVVSSEIEVETETARTTFLKSLSASAKWKFAALLIAAMLIIPAFVAWKYSRSSAARATVPAMAARQIPVTSYTGEEIEPSISPDGKFVAYCGTNTSTTNHRPNDPQVKSRFNIYVKQSDGESVLQLTDKPGRAITPSWSPDGKYIAYAQKPSDGNVDTNYLFIIPAFGGPERKIHEAPDLIAVSWSPDGDTLAFAARQNATSPHKIYIISIQSRAVRQLTFSEDGDDIATNFSPDGTSVSFVRHRNKSAELFVVPVAGGAEKQITALNAGILGRADWTPDGDKLLFGSNRLGTYRLWQIGIDGNGLKLVEGAGEPAHDPSISVDGHRMTYNRLDIDYNVWRVPLTDRKGDAADAEKIVSSYRSDRSPDVSRDGKRVAFVSNQNGAARQVWIADADGKGQRQMTTLPDGSNIGRVLWSPDGSRLVFDATAIGGRSAIYSIDVERSLTQQRTDGSTDAAAPAWSADGSYIYYSQKISERSEIYKIPVLGGESSLVTKNGGFEMRESSDGRFLYFNKPGYGTLGIFRLPVGTEDAVEEKVLDLYQVESIGEWTLADDGIYYIHRAEVFEIPSKFPRIRFLSFANGTISDVLPLPLNPLSNPGLSISADGKWLYYGINDRTDVDIMLVENSN